MLVRSGGFLTQSRVRRILTLKGYDIGLARPGPDDCVGVWGQSPSARRGEALAARHGLPIVRVEDAFLRSLHPGRAGEPPLGLLIDTRGVHFDPARPSDLEEILADHPLDDTALLNRARGCIERMREAELGKYAAFDPQADPPAPGYVLVIDQVRGDASVTASGADRNRFLEMLFLARQEHPGARILVKRHPESLRSARPGFFDARDLGERVQFVDGALSPWALFSGAVGVYTVSSQAGFEAIFAGHRPRIFGQPFYAGWGLTDDEFPLQRRQRRLTRAQLFAAAMMLYPVWYDPFRDRLCALEDALETLAADARCWREDRRGWVAGGMVRWKRPTVRRFFGRHGPLRFEDDPRRASATGLPRMVWASRAEPDDDDAVRVEDGFLRSRGLGAALNAPLSLVADRAGIYYDPSRPSDLERFVAARTDLTPAQFRRVRDLMRAITSDGLSKYNVGAPAPALPDGFRVLVAGQVEDDASVIRGARVIRTNRALLEAARRAHPDAIVIYKPHPDVEAGLRPGALAAGDLADVVAHRTDPADLLGQVGELWTMTSLLGFEALLRGVKVVTTGAPFYAGWGLTEDRGVVPPRRRARPSLEGLVHATLIDYPRYVDPVTGLPCPVEVVVERLASGQGPGRPAGLRFLSVLQGLLARHTAPARD
ncbi:capsular polysaccharide biosynthesis protein [Sulfitobacter sp. LCG007]